MNKETLTVFTPAYNRAHTIERTYKSLCRQTSMDFVWLIVDDGSTDDTRTKIESWLRSDSLNRDGDEIKGYALHGSFKIHYIYQKNQGMHGAHNTAYSHISTELNTCIDSDDYMPDDAVEKIVKFWRALSPADRLRYAGIIGLDRAEGGGIIGTTFPSNMKETTLQGFYLAGGRGDKKLVYRTDVVKKYPSYPLFDDERYVGLAALYYMIDCDYKLLTYNEPLVIVDYQMDGSSYNMYNQYWKNPKGFSYYRKVEMRCTPSLKRRLVSCMHYVSSSIRARNASFIKDSPYPLTTLCMIPAGWALYLFIRHKVRTGQKMKNI